MLRFWALHRWFCRESRSYVGPSHVAQAFGMAARVGALHVVLVPMKRRAFFHRVFGGLAAAVVAPFLPAVPAAKPLGLVFHKDAFALAMAPLTEEQYDRYLTTWAAALADRIDLNIGRRYEEIFLASGGKGYVVTLGGSIIADPRGSKIQRPRGELMHQRKEA